jgi:hypothetical protein
VNLRKSKLRRTTSLIAGTVLGLAGVVAFAAPASAHHSVVSGTPKCDTATGDWVVTWDIDTVSPQREAPNYRFVQFDVTPAGSTVTNVATNTAIVATDTHPQTYPYTSNQTLVGEQRLPGSATSASLTVRAQWNNRVKDTKPHTATVNFDGTCAKDAPKPDAKLANTCEGVTVTLFNGEDAKVDAVFTVKGDNDFSKTVTVKAGKDGVTVDVPAKDAGKIVVTEKNSEKPVLEGSYEQPENCQPEDNVSRTLEATCDSITFTLDNTKGTKDISATFTPNKGDAQTLNVKAGESGDVTFKGEKGLEISITEAGQDAGTISYDKEKPEDCATPPPGDDTGLPVTGAAAGGIAGGAAVLLALGAVLFIVARRRRVKFTA